MSVLVGVDVVIIEESDLNDPDQMDMAIHLIESEMVDVDRMRQEPISIEMPFLIFVTNTPLHESSPLFKVITISE